MNDTEQDTPVLAAPEVDKSPQTEEEEEEEEEENVRTSPPEAERHKEL